MLNNKPLPAIAIGGKRGASNKGRHYKYQSCSASPLGVRGKAGGRAGVNEGDYYRYCSI
jgi:hypothetical protein